MAASPVAPLDRESPFGVDELFFSTTDRKGVIRSGNDVFVRVSRWEREELQGAPHNLIRHPDMPRAVFKLLWDTIGAGETIAAYVKNMARDGSYYWVVAVVQPVGDGYLSVRLKPTSELLPTVAAVYAAVRACEDELERKGLPRKEVIARSAQLLLTTLADAGFPDYASFMRHLLPAELAAREAARRPPETRTRPPSGEPESPLATIAHTCSTLHDYLYGLFTNLDGYRQLSATLGRKSAFVLGLADEIRLFSLNALIASTRLDQEGASLSVISDIMRDRSRETAAIIGELDAGVAEVQPLLSDLGFEIAVAKLQTEMAVEFARTLLEHRGEAAAALETDRLMREDIGALTTCICAGVTSIGRRLAAVDAALSAIAGHVGRLGRQLRFLSALHTNGRVEAARLADPAAFSQLFQEIGGQITAAGDEVREFAAIASAASRATATAGGGAVQAQLCELERLVAGLGTDPAAVPEPTPAGAEVAPAEGDGDVRLAA